MIVNYYIKLNYQTPLKLKKNLVFGCNFPNDKKIIKISNFVA